MALGLLRELLGSLHPAKNGAGERQAELRDGDRKNSRNTVLRLGHTWP